MIRALGISSGGLDSILSALILKEQGVDVSWISFITPFFSSKSAEKAASTHNIPLKVKDITKPYLSLLESPKAGFGKNMNPCMDCHALMFAMAGKEMKNNKFDFLFSGEVVGQRPKSQTKNALRYVEKNSGFEGFILRPLSARLLPKTIPEQKEWVDRSKLFDISGRSRKAQMDLAKKYSVDDFPIPAGGCLLTDSIFSGKLKELMSEQEDFEIRELHLLKHGRHFRLKNRLKVIVGRKKEDNENIVKYYRKDKDILLNPASLPGPAVLIVSDKDTKEASEAEKIASIICASYTKAKPGDATDIHIQYPDREKTIQIKAKAVSEFKELMI